MQLGVPVRFDPDTRDSPELRRWIAWFLCRVVTNDADPHRYTDDPSELLMVLGHVD
jgi:hypothetical protein